MENTLYFEIYRTVADTMGDPQNTRSWQGWFPIQISHHLADITQASFPFRVFRNTLTIPKFLFHFDLFHDGRHPVILIIFFDVIS